MWWGLGVLFGWLAFSFACSLARLGLFFSGTKLFEHSRKQGSFNLIPKVDDELMPKQRGPCSKVVNSVLVCVDLLWFS